MIKRTFEINNNKLFCVSMTGYGHTCRSLRCLP